MRTPTDDMLDATGYFFSMLETVPATWWDTVKLWVKNRILALGNMIRVSHKVQMRKLDPEDVIRGPE